MPLEAKWPLGLDLLWAAYQHARAARILHFFVEIIEELPPTFEQRLLGISGIDTVDPRNIESVLATQFTGGFALRKNSMDLLTISFKHSGWVIVQQSFIHYSVTVFSRKTAKVGSTHESFFDLFSSANESTTLSRYKNMSRHWYPVFPKGRS